jgi:hypothetical protein
MDIKEELISVIENTLSQTLDIYFSYAWREKIGEFLEEESKYTKLVCWIDKEIDICTKAINVFSPADRDEDYKNRDIKEYLNSMQKLSTLLHFRLLLIDSRSNTKIRENIEYTICKLYDISYSEQLEDYV